MNRTNGPSRKMEKDGETNTNTVWKWYKFMLVWWGGPLGCAEILENRARWLSNSRMLMRLVQVIPPQFSILFELLEGEALMAGKAGNIVDVRQGGETPRGQLQPQEGHIANRAVLAEWERWDKGGDP